MLAVSSKPANQTKLAQVRRKRVNIFRRIWTILRVLSGKDDVLE